MGQPVAAAGQLARINDVVTNESTNRLAIRVGYLTLLERAERSLRCINLDVLRFTTGEMLVVHRAISGLDMLHIGRHIEELP